MRDKPRPPKRLDPASISDLRGVGRLLGDAVIGVAGVVEEMHRNIVRLAPIVGDAPQGRTRGITRLVYRSVRGVTGAVGVGLETALDQVAPLVGDRRWFSPRRESAVAVLNGVWGDHLAESGNPLAIPMRIRRAGQPLALDRAALRTACAPATGRLLVMVHGLCMNDLQWSRAGHDHGAALARDLGYTAVHLHYNSGRHISSNGREFAHVMERLVREWPAQLTEVVIVGHSMGGMVARSACHYARLADHAWLRRLTRLVFLGTPHHGAPLERAGNRFDLFLEISPYTAPFGRAGATRSAGIKDLRHGNLVDEDWRGRRSAHADDARRMLPLPQGVQCFAVAATRSRRPPRPGERLPGDGLVPVASALGRHPDRRRDLSIPDSHQHLCRGVSHFDLLASHEAYARIRDWLE